MAGSTEGKDIEEVKEVKERSARSAPVRKYTDLLIYKQAYRLALEVSKVTKLLPRQEQFELGRQLRRSARSIAANIVEGWAKRNSAAEFKRHLMIAAGEVPEAQFWLDLATDEAFLSSRSSRPLQSEYSKLGFMIHNLWKEWRKL